MKYIITLNVILLFLFLGMNTAKADCDYLNFQEINFLEEGELLRNINVDDYYQNVKKRKFAGWNVHYISQGAKVNYKTETLLDYYNQGSSAIKYEYKTTEKDNVKFAVSVTGELGTETTGTVEKLKTSLSKKLKIEGEYEKTTSTTVETSVKVDVDPNTQLIIYIYGEGYITNGVAASYAFFVRCEMGGFEYFSPTTQYQKIVKKVIK